MYESKEKSSRMAHFLSLLGFNVAQAFSLAEARILLSRFSIQKQQQ